MLLMEKLTISMAIFNSFLYVYQRVNPAVEGFDSDLLLVKSCGSRLWVLIKPHKCH